MTATLAHPMSFPEIGLNEQDQDPNSALLELDRGLKSTNVGEQCEAISRFPNLFEKYPFPILINSALLKLAEVFRAEAAGTNDLVRVCVCEVLETSARHLDKLINVEEFLRRITTVMHSNDPIARALTLRALGLLCRVVGEGKQVHHLVRDALDASHPLELQAAIGAAEKYAAVSKIFAVSMCERLTEMLSALSTPVEVKLQLIKVFQHMHHDAETAAQVRSVCLQLLERCPTQRVVITTLHALTQLAAHCLVHIPHQVDLLLCWVSRECRAGVRDAALQELRYLASAAPHAWSSGNVAALVNFTRSTRHTTSLHDCQDGSEVVGNMANLNLSRNGSTADCFAESDQTTAAALDVLATLTSAPALPQLNLSPECDVFLLSKEFVYDANQKIATIALQLSTNIALYMHEEKEKGGKGSSNTPEVAGSTSASVLVCSDTLSAGVSLLNSLALEAGQNPEATKDALKIPLVCCVLLARCDDNLARSLSHTLVSLLTDDSLPASAGGCRVVVCEALASLGGSKKGVIASHMPALLGFLHSITNKDCPKTNDNTRLISVMCSVIFQAYLGHAWDKIGLESIMVASRRTDNWTSYRIARQAARYGHHQVAANIYNSLRSKVCSDQQHYWLTALSQVSTGEAWTVSPSEQSKDDKVQTDVVDDRATPLTSAANSLYSALSNFKACSTGQFPLSFVQQYTSLRAATLSCHSQLITTCQSMRTSPPPAIAASHVVAFRDEMVKCCRLLQQLNKLAKDFDDLSQDYAKLYQAQFDADPQTLSNISMLQQGIKVMIRAINVLTKPITDHSYQGGAGTSSAVGSSSADGVPELNTSPSSVQEQLLVKALTKANSAITDLEQLCLEKKPITECQLLLLTGISEMLTGVPLPYPRLFYQSLQHTSITLNITPQPRTPGDPITIQNSSQLAVKVEGVISHGRRPGIFRSIKSVTLLVNSTMQVRLPHSLPPDGKEGPNESLTQTVQPHNDFFSAQFLLAYPVPGQYQVTIDASVVDESDEPWQTGPRHSLTVKALEDPTNVKTQQPGPSNVQGPPPPPIRAQIPPPGMPPSMPPHPQQIAVSMQPQQHVPPVGVQPPLMPAPPGSLQYQATPPPGQVLGSPVIPVQAGMPPMAMQMQYQPPPPVPSMSLLGNYPRPPM